MTSNWQNLEIDTVYLHENLTILALAIAEISLGAQKFKVGHVTLTTPLLRVICHQYAGT